MSIAIVTWPINDVGGINSWCINFTEGLKKLEVPYQVYYATSQLRFNCDPDHELIKSRYSLLPSKHLSYHPKKLRETITELNRHSLILMLHPSPHPTKVVNSSKFATNWMHLYTDTKPPKLVVFHDANWQKTNSWFSEVSESVDLIIAAQKLFFPSVIDYPSDCPKKWEYFPLDLDKGRELVRQGNNRHGLIVCTQWLKWKNHSKLLPVINDIKTGVDLYGNGQEYYTLRKSGLLQQAVRLDKTTGERHNQKSSNIFHGFVPYSDILERMSSSTAALDLSTKGYTNMTHWEPLSVDAVSLIEQRVAEHPDNQIPPDCCSIYRMESLVGDINQLLSSSRDRDKIIIRGRKFIKKADCVDVVRRTLTWANKQLGLTP